MIITPDQHDELICQLKKLGWKIRQHQRGAPNYSVTFCRKPGNISRIIFSCLGGNYRCNSNDTSFHISSSKEVIFTTFLALAEEAENLRKAGQKKVDDKNIIKIVAEEDELSVAKDFFLASGKTEIFNWLNNSRPIRTTNKKTQQQLQSIASELIALALGK